jgi:anaerobic dimethyl sulfoxide reductase subunit A
MHPQDAAARGINDGERARLFNGRGVVHLTVRLSDSLAPGVVCLREGVWIELNGEGQDIAGSANMVTSTEGTAPGVACIMHGVGVEVEREDGQ